MNRIKSAAKRFLRWREIRVTREPVTPRVRDLYRKYADATMIEPGVFAENLLLVGRALDNPSLHGGAIVECGTWRGGMAAALMEVGGSERPYLFFDSFEGLPPAQEIDGIAAQQWQADPNPELHFNNCNASLAEFESVIKRVSPSPLDIKIHKGFFASTFPQAQDIPPIAVLRLDADWYSSTMACLQKFWDLMLPGGLILIDDYGAWDGCTKAVHDFLSERKAAEPIRRGHLAGVTYITKGSGRVVDWL